MSFQEATVYFAARCADTVERQFPDLDSLLDYENSNKRKITQLGIAARDDTKSVEIRFGELSWRTMQIIANGDDKFVTEIADDLRELGVECRPWYWPCYAIDFTKLFFFITLMSGFIGVAILAFAKINKTGLESLTAIAMTRSIASGLFYGCVINLVIFALGKMRDIVFPRVVFEIGCQKRRKAILEKVRWTVVIGSLAALGRAAFLSTFE